MTDDNRPLPQLSPVQHVLNSIEILSQDVSGVLCNLNITKSCGPDLVSPPRLLKAAGSVLARPLSMIFNRSLDQGYFPVHWMVWFGWLGINCPLRQYFSLYRAVSQRQGERGERIDESKNVQTTPTRTYCKSNRPLPYCNQNCRTPRHWKFTQDHRTTRPPSSSLEAWHCVPIL